MEQCPCGSSKAYADCCERLHRGLGNTPTAESLMRARYTAHVKEEIDYIYETTHPSKRKNYDRKAVLAWVINSTWKGLEILGTDGGGLDDDAGTVEFVARYREKEKPVSHHEIAEFVKNQGKWFFMNGQAPKPVTVVRSGPKIGRNDLCNCGSGKKFKKCCGKVIKVI